MKPKTFIPLLTLAVAATAFTACDDTDGTSVVPQFDKIDIAPNRPAPGDSLTATAHQAVKGKLINATTYNWTFTYYVQHDDGSVEKLDTTLTHHTNYDGESSDDPSIGYRLPATAVGGTQMQISLRATYNCSGQTASGALYGEATRSTTVYLQ